MKPNEKKQPEQSPKNKEEKINWKEMMGMNRPTYKRNKGALRQK